MNPDDTPLLDRSHVDGLLVDASMCLGRALGDVMEFEGKQSVEWFESSEAKTVETLQEQLSDAINVISDVRKTLKN